MYKTVVIEYSPKTDNMAQKVEEKANCPERRRAGAEEQSPVYGRMCGERRHETVLHDRRM